MGDFLASPLGRVLYWIALAVLVTLLVGRGLAQPEPNIVPGVALAAVLILVHAVAAAAAAWMSRRMRSRTRAEFALLRPNADLRRLVIRDGTELALVDGELRPRLIGLGAVSVDDDGLVFWSWGGRRVGTLRYAAIVDISVLTRREGGSAFSALGLRTSGGFASALLSRSTFVAGHEDVERFVLAARKAWALSSGARSDTHSSR